MGGKQKVVVRVPICNEKGRSRALKAVVSVRGFLSVSLEGADKNMVVVIGEGIDSVCLTECLRKKVGAAELVTVGPVEEKKQPDNKDNKDSKDDKKPSMVVESVPWPCGPGYVICVPEPFPPPPPVYNPDPCSIM